MQDKAEDQRYQDIISEKFSNANQENIKSAEIIQQLSKVSYDAAQEAQPDMAHRPGVRSP